MGARQDTTPPAVALPPPHMRTMHMRVCLPSVTPHASMVHPIPDDERYAADPYMGVFTFPLIA